MLPSPPAEMDYRSVPKRKRDDIEGNETRDCTFQLEDLSTSSFLSFEPKSKLLRAHLPLSWLGSSSGNNGPSAGTLLHGEISYVMSWEYSVLVARHVPYGGLFALEKIEDCYHIIQPLQPFVSEKWIRDASFGAGPPVSMQMVLHYLPTPELSQTNDHSWTPSLSSDTVFKVPKNRRGAAARLSILSHPGKQEDSSPSSKLASVPKLQEDTGDVHQVGVSARLDGETIPDTNSTILETQAHTETEQGDALEETQTDHLAPTYLRQRYLEFLYRSKASLAFYSKGPLSRAKARVKAANASMTSADLAKHYRESILPAKKLDLKYKESIMDVIQKLILESPEDETMAKKKVSKRSKLGKDGLWPVEADFIRDWWKTKDLPSAVTQEQQEKQIKDIIAALRMREVQMQIILILENLTLEAKQVERAVLTPQQTLVDPDVKLESIENAAPSDPKPSKNVKERNLEADLDLLADKLCIWHSIGLESNLSMHGRSATKNHEEEEEHHQSRDRLKNFCVDVVIHFYGSRLPLLCRSLCRTLAGPEVFDQATKANQVRENATKNIPPGAALGRRVPSQSGPLERVLSGEGLRKSSLPALTRSATLPTAPQLKRKSSEVFQRPSSRQTSVSFSNREVDLAADAHATHSKKRKLDRVTSQKQELAAAIQALKKPNRQIAGKAYMDDVELRKMQLKQPVLITATPRVNRKRDAEADEARENEFLPRPAVDDHMIPSSSMKARPANPLSSTARSSSTKRAVLAALHDTPSRSASRRSESLKVTASMSHCVEQKPLTTGHIPATPTKSRQVSVVDAFKTPAKRDANQVGGKENRFELNEEAFETMKRAMSKPVSDTIYDTLGWDDDYEI